MLGHGNRLEGTAVSQIALDDTVDLRELVLTHASYSLPERKHFRRGEPIVGIKLVSTHLHKMGG